MATIIKADFPHVFSAFATDSSISDIRYFNNRKTYFCNYCSQTFTVDWHIRAHPSTPYICRGKTVFCPYCGYLHEKQICYMQRNLSIPYKIELILYIYKEKIALQATYGSISFKSKEFSYDIYQGKEIFTFDIVKSYSKFEKFMWTNEKVNYTSSEITTDTANEIIKHSALYYLNHESFAFKDSSIKKIFRTLQLELQNKLFKKHGEKIHSLRINMEGLPNGALLTALLNFARRVKNIDAPNFTVKTPLPPSAPFTFFEFLIDFSESIVRKAAQALLSGKDDITAVVKALDLRNSFSIRKIIEDNPANAIILSKVFSVFTNYDFAMRAYCIYMYNHNIKYLSISKVVSSLKKLRPFYSEKSLVDLLEDKHSSYQAGDVVSLTYRLKKSYFDLLREKKLRIRDLHNWLVKNYNLQEQRIMELKRQRNMETRMKRIQMHVSKMLHVSDAIVKQLTLSINSFKFELPKETIDLLKAGQVLGNCVGMYDEKIEKGHCVVVLVSDDSGIKASLEIKDNSIVQAEISHHRPPSADPAINQAIVNWSKQTGLSINTTAISIAA